MHPASSGSKPANWDLRPFFSALTAPDYEEFRSVFEGDVVRLAKEIHALPELEWECLEPWIQFLVEFEELGARERHLGAYLGCLGSADARDELTQREIAHYSVQSAEMEKVKVALRARLADAPLEGFTALIEDPRVAPVRYALERQRTKGQQAMPREQEELAAELAVTGISAWGRLYDQISGNLQFTLEVDASRQEVLPVSMVRSLLGDPDPRVRKAALLGGNRAWKTVADSLAGCLNAISGTRLSLYRRRGIGHFLDPALFDAGIQRSTLDALLSAVRDRQELPRKYIRAKARALGRERIGFQDLEAPLPGSGERRISWETACRRVLHAFGKYESLQTFARHALSERWIDWEPREGKRPGGFCTSSAMIEQSRIFMTFAGAIGDVSTLAHELGHAFHNRVMRGMRPWSRNYPMTLAETASTFAEQLVTDDVLESPDAGPLERLQVLDTLLSDSVAFLLNIPMRFDFECALYQERAQGELSVSRLEELMTKAQRDNFGDSLADDELDPMFWASKLHFYITDVSFYNFPYTFGYLFSRGLFARAKEEGPQFFRRYEELLALTGQDTAENLARRLLGIELGEPAFWHSSIDRIEHDLRAFELLVR